MQQQRELKFEEKVLMTVLSWQKQAEESQRKKALEQLQKSVSGKSCHGSGVLKLSIYNVNQDFSRQQR